MIPIWLLTLMHYASLTAAIVILSLLARHAWLNALGAKADSASDAND